MARIGNLRRIPVGIGALALVGAGLVTWAADPAAAARARLIGERA
jgi:hypothetical protein